MAKAVKKEYSTRSRIYLIKSIRFRYPYLFMPVFFVPSKNINDKVLNIKGLLFQHLSKSLRMREGEELIVGDEARQRYHLRIESLSKTTLTGRIFKTEQGPPPTKASIILGQSILKSDHMKWAIQKATELGVSVIVPLLTNRVVVRPRAERVELLQERYARIALDAAQQSERWEVPQVLLPIPIQKFFEQYRLKTIKCLLVERGESQGLQTLPLDNKFSGTVVLTGGPEGGWTEQEQETAKQFDFISFSLGASILRGETVPLAALSIIQSRLGNLG